MVRHLSSGFTIIELLVVLTILCILTGFAYPALREELDEHKFRAVVEAQRIVLIHARDKAIETGEKQTIEVDGYSLDFFPNRAYNGPDEITLQSDDEKFQQTIYVRQITKQIKVGKLKKNTGK